MDPNEHEQGGEAEDFKRPLPRAKQHDALAEQGRDDGDDHEYCHHKRHHAGHGAAGHQVTYDRNGDDAHTRGKDALDEAHHQKGGKTTRHGASDARDAIADEADAQEAFAPEAVRYGAENKLRRAEAEDVGEDDILLVIRVGQAVMCGNFAERWEHDVYSERVERHKPRDHADQFP